MLKIKPLTKEQLIISIDRLTRFKNPEQKYTRVFKDIILSNLITPKFNKIQLNEMNYTELTNLAEQIINYSFKELGLNLTDDYTINYKLRDYENSTYIINSDTKILLDNEIDYAACLDFIDSNSPINLQWLKTLSNDTQNQREKYSLKYPIEKVVISEGITEEILLPKFAELYGYDFNKNGVNILSAGGKNQVVKLYYQLAEELKLPIYILLDSDAQKNYDEIQLKLRKFDKIHILQNGEFEDILPINLIKKSLSYGLNNISIINDNDLIKHTSMVKTLEDIFRNRGLHEFKKAEFAQTVKQCISEATDISPEISEIIEEIKYLSRK